MAHCDGGAGAAGGAGGSNFGVSGSANGGSACESVFNASTPACATGAGGDANGGNPAQAVLAASVLAALAVTAASPSVGTAVLGGVACFEPGSCFNTNAGTSGNAEAEVEAEGGNGGLAATLALVQAATVVPVMPELAEAPLAVLLVAVVHQAVLTH